MIKQLSLYILMLSVVVVFTACNSGVEPVEQNVPVEVNDRCFGLDEEACFASNQCRGFYSPVRCYPDFCTSETFFDGCQEIPAEELDQAEQNKILCENTGGKWKVEYSLKPGKCICENPPFKKGEGCIGVPDVGVSRTDFLSKYCIEFENTGEWYCSDLKKYPGGVEGFREKCESIGYEYGYNAKGYAADQMGTCVRK